VVAVLLLVVAVAIARPASASGSAVMFADVKAITLHGLHAVAVTIDRAPLTGLFSRIEEFLPLDVYWFD
jgi:hypothetical protein